MTILACENLSKRFREGDLDVSVLKNVNFSLEAGQRVAIIGASGSGKSTLLHLLGGLDLPSEGQVVVNGMAMQRLSDKKRGQLRNQYLGFVYQFHHLLPEFTAVENVAMPLFIRGVAQQEAEEKAKHLLAEVGLEKRFDHRSVELSGGERQRAAIARALITEPSCVLADEPTGNLDHHTADTVIDVMMRLNEEHKTALLIVTHSRAQASKMDRVYRLDDGQLSQLP